MNLHKNIERHTADTIVSWPNPKQWVILHTSDLMMIIRQSIYILSIITRVMVKLKTYSPTYCILDNRDNMLNLNSYQTRMDGLMKVYTQNMISNIRKYQCTLSYVVPVQCFIMLLPLTTHTGLLRIYRLYFASDNCFHRVIIELLTLLFNEPQEVSVDLVEWRLNAKSHATYQMILLHG